MLSKSKNGGRNAVCSVSGWLAWEVLLNQKASAEPKKNFAEKCRLSPCSISGYVDWPSQPNTLMLR
jgi:hypothetical protein